MPKKASVDLPIYEYDENINGQKRYFMRPYIDGVQKTFRKDENGNMWLGLTGYAKLVASLVSMMTGENIIDAGITLQASKVTFDEKPYLELKELIDGYLNSKEIEVKCKNLSKKTLRNYRSNLYLYVIPFFYANENDHVNVYDITPEKAQKWHNYISSRTVENTKIPYKLRFKQDLHNIFSQVFKYGMLIYPDLTSNPLATIGNFKKKRGEKKEKDFLTEHEFLKAILYENNFRIKKFLELLFYTGLRINELAGVKLCDINLEKRYIYVRTSIDQHAESEDELEGPPKTDSSLRYVPLLDEAIDIIKEVMNENPRENLNAYLFERDKVTETRSFLAEETIRRHLKTIVRKAGIDKEITPHCLRHSFSTMCQARGIDIRIVSKILGHSDYNITYSIYTHTDQKEILKFNELFHAKS